MPKIRFLKAVVLVASLAVVSTAQAAVETWNIDSTQSSLSVGGSLAGTTASAQTAGSTSTSYQGTIKVDRQASTIQFVAGSVVDAILQAQNQAPRAGEAGRTGPADYGRFAHGGPPLFTDINEALRGFQLDLGSDPINITGTPGNSSFPSNDFFVTVTSGTSDYAYGNQFGDVDLSGKQTFNGSSTPSTIQTVNGVPTMTIFFSTGNVLYGVQTSNDSTVSFSGKLVATLVPEPAMGSIVLLGIAMGAMTRRR